MSSRQISNSLFFSVSPDAVICSGLLCLLLVYAPFTQGQSLAAAGAKQYYVSADASPDGDGSFNRPFLFLSQAESAAKAGEVIYLIASDENKLINGGITLKPQQKLIGLSSRGQLLANTDRRARVTNTTDQLEGVIVQLSEANEVAGIHFQDMRNYAISGAGTDYSGLYIHDSLFTGNAPEHIEDERGLVYAVSLDAGEGERDSIRIENSSFRDGEDLGAIRVFQSGDSRGNYRFQGNDFSDLGGRAYFVRTRQRSKVETVILDSQADNIGLGDRNSDSIIPYLMGQSEQVMLVRNYRFNNSRQVGSPSNTGIEAFMFGSPRPDEANWCTSCKLTLKILDSVIENAVTDPIQFSNSGRNSQLAFEIRNTRIIGGNPQQGGGGISLNLQSVADSGSRTTLLVENTDIIGTTGFGFSMNNRGGGEDFTVVVDFGGGALGSSGNNRFINNAAGAMRVPPNRVTAQNNWWGGETPRIYNGENEPITESRVVFQPMLRSNPR